MSRETPRARRRWRCVPWAGAAALACSLTAPRGAPAAPPDLADEVLYEIMPIAWRDSDNDQFRFGDFGGMTASLDYLKGLGVTGVWTTPIFPSAAYHGYQHAGADRVNPRLGTEAEFLAFVHAAHEKGMKVFIDFVAYGISQETTYFRDSYKNPSSVYTPWLAYNDPKNETYDGYTFRTWDGTQVGFVRWNLNSSEPRDLVTKWAVHWLDPNGDGDVSDGVDGFRLDQVWEEYKEGTNGWGYSIKNFWIPWKRALRKTNPDVITFAEQAQWETTGEQLLPAFDAAFTKPFEGAVRESIRERTAEPVYRAASEARRTARRAPKNEWGGKGTYLAIIGDHDVDRLASDVEPRRSGPDPLMRRPELAAVMLMTQEFPPVIYMGDEIGMLGVRQKWGGDANDIPVREPFKWKAEAGAPMTDYWRPSEQATSHAYSHDHDGRSVEEQAGRPGSLLETYRSLIALRKSSVALRHGEYTPLRSDDPALWIFLRQTASQTILVAVNLEDAPLQVSLQPPRAIGRWNAWDKIELFRLPVTGGTAPTLETGEGHATLSLAPLGAVVYELKRAASAP